MGQAFFRYLVIDKCHIFGLNHVNLIVWPKKVNEARGLIFGINTFIYMISIHTKYHRSSFSCSLVIITCNILCLKYVFLTCQPKNKLWTLLIFWIDSCEIYWYLYKKISLLIYLIHLQSGLDTFYIFAIFGLRTKSLAKNLGSKFWPYLGKYLWKKSGT